MGAEEHRGGARFSSRHLFLTQGVYKVVLQKSISARRGEEGTRGIQAEAAWRRAGRACVTPSRHTRPYKRGERSAAV